MANTFFGFNTTLTENAELGDYPEEDVDGLEKDYDALNDETFGGCEGDLGDDWEKEHEQFAEIAESSRHSLSDNIEPPDIESILDHLGLNDEDDRSRHWREKSVWSYSSQDAERNGDKNSSINSNKFLTNSLQNDKKAVGAPALFPAKFHPRLLSPQLPKVRTVEELERMLINQSKQPNSPTVNNMPPQQNHHGFNQHPHMPIPPRYPPGFHPIIPHHPPGGNHPLGPPQSWQQYPHMPPGMMRMVGPHNRVPPPHIPHVGPGPPPGFPGMYHPNGPYPMNPHFNYPPPRPAVQRTGNYQQQKPRDQSQYRHRDNMNHISQNENKDEYAGLMVNREKQWLLNIQLLQVNTGTPYFDDYYYTVFKERQIKNNKENQPSNNNQRFYNGGGGRYNQRDGHHRQNQERDRQNKEQENPLKGKVYTPLQFENSLGKLQFASVTAPRKIIDMDIINLEKDSDSPQCTRDSRKTKQLLLELEALYNLMLRAEDLKNPLAISNTEKLKELKQKQRLREIEAAPTPEQKQEVLKLLQQESLAVVENQQDLLNKIVNALLQDDKLSSFVGIRKGKMLLLRLLPHLTPDIYSSQHLELWIKLLLSVCLIGRRDTIGDNILPRFHPHFKKFINNCDIQKILEIVMSLKETIKLENNRSTPLSHQNKSPLHFIVTNKFGISCMSSIITKVEYLADCLSDRNLSDWCCFLINLTETLATVGTSVAVPIESISMLIISKHTSRFNMLTQDKISILNRVFVEID